MKRHKWLVSCDWLTLNYRLPVQLSASEFEQQVLPLFEFERMPYSTRHFAYIYKLYIWDDCHIRKEECLQVVFSPLSKILHPCLLQIKISNAFLYNRRAASILKKCEKALLLTYQGVSRVDICVDSDFQNIKELTNGLRDGSIRMKGRKKIQEYYTIEQGKMEYEGVKFGSNISAYTFKIYNKTKEIVEESLKWYILDYWKANGFADDAIIWRYEFSILDLDKLEWADGKPFDGRELLSNGDRLVELLMYYREKIKCVQLSEKWFENNPKPYVRFTREEEYPIIPSDEFINKPKKIMSVETGSRIKTAKTTISMCLDYLLSNDLSKFEAFHMLNSVYVVAQKNNILEWLEEKKSDEIDSIMKVYDMFAGIKTGDVIFKDLFMSEWEIK